MPTFRVSTHSRTDLVDITAQVVELVQKSGLQAGAVLVYVPHTTAGITINENADPSVRRDLATVLDRLVPWENNYEHGEGNAAAHAKAALVGSSVTIPVENGAPALGTWQGIYLCEFDGPRTRQVVVQLLAAGGK
jgi:secondary thiamine-phosphate synthase enzyme